MFELKRANSGNFKESAGVKIKIPTTYCISKITSLYWNEHCLECAAPECYKTCLIFEDDGFQKCSRTHYGVRRIPTPGNYLYNHAINLKFRQWGKLRCEYNEHMVFKTKAFKLYYSIYIFLRKLLKFCGYPLNLLRSIPINLFRNIPKDLFARALSHYIAKAHDYKGEGEVLDGLLFSCRSHHKENYSMLIESIYKKEIIAKESVKIKQGVNNFFFPIMRLKNNREINAIRIYPENNINAELTIYILDIIKVNKQCGEYKNLFKSVFSTDKVKCVIWDLDNTLWNGILSEDGEENLIVDKKAVEVIKELDNRGILQSISSKNDFDKAWEILKELGIDEYFLFPQINWNAKTQNIQKIVDNLNIGMDTIAFVDDSAIERNEVKGFLPSVRVYTEKQINNLLFFNEFNVPTTKDSKNRRLYYKNEINRHKIKKALHIEDNNEFIKKCEIIVSLFEPQSDDEIMRCVELIQRTNQLNTSGRRLSKDEFKSVLFDKDKLVFGIKSQDKFGKYGIVGCIVFKVIEDKINITDFVLSCRVAAKKIENALIKNLSLLFKRQMIHVKYVKTDRNHVIKKVLIDMGAQISKTGETFVIDEKNINIYDLVTVRLEK